MSNKCATIRLSILKSNDICAIVFIMAKTVFILGAGASADTGAPLMYNFLDKAEELFHQGKVRAISDDLHEHFNKVFNALHLLQPVYAKSTLNLDNIEDVFSAFETAMVIDKFPGLSPVEISDLPVSLKLLILITLQETIRYSYAPDRKRFIHTGAYRLFLTK